MRLSSRQSRTDSKRRTRETVILFSIGAFSFAIAAGAVDEIREIAGLRELRSGLSHPRLAKVRHTLDRQGRCYFVAEAARHFHVSDSRPGRLMVLRNLPVALIVDAIDRMQELRSIQALPEAFSGEERGWYRGLTVIGGRVVPIVNSETFLNKAEITLLTASMRGREADRVAMVSA